ncbi:MAG: TetR/AcrR family transcriptional regulator [Gluconobacter cerinus]|uniref:TetR/AcrR family transcriptional regulator n=1 Tax=Gluconobacter cerinus TaxID=38307 RepID=UPI0039E79578
MTGSGGRSRTAILQNIAEVFRQYGYEGASLSRFTAATGLGKGSLYNFFPEGKKQMAAEVLEHIQQWFDAEIFSPLETEEDPKVGLTAMFEGTEQYFRSGQRICLMGLLALSVDTSFAVQIRNYFLRWQESLSQALQRLGRSKSNAVDLAEEIVSGIQGALVLAHARGEADVFKRRLVSFKLRLDLPAGHYDERQ